MLRDKHKKLIDKELEEMYDFGYHTIYTRRDQGRGWDVHMVYEKISCTNVSLPQHLLDEILDLEAEQ